MNYFDLIKRVFAQDNKKKYECNVVFVTTPANETFSFHDNGNAARGVDWGDGTIDFENLHSYSESGTYAVQIKGKLERDDGDSNFGVFASRYGSSLGKNGIKTVYCYDIGQYAFAFCEGLSSVIFLNGSQDIPDYAFAYTTSLFHIELPRTITRIGDHAFDGSGITGLTIPYVVTSIGKYSFSLCMNLRGIRIPSSVLTIGDGAFQDSGLTQIRIEIGLQYIGSGAFDGLGSLSITYDGSRDQWNAIQKEQDWSGNTTVSVKCSDDD